MNDRKRPLSEFSQNYLRYEYDEARKSFHHNFNQDCHAIVIWENARHKESQILEDLRKRFDVRYMAEIHWSWEEIANNFQRLYGKLPNKNQDKDVFHGRAKKVGAGPFILIIVEDKNPIYFYEQTWSGKYELVNSNITAAKADYRAWTGGGYNVHSSNSLGEAIRDSTLLLGGDKIQTILSSSTNSNDIEVIYKDLEGYDGWHSSRHLFQTLNLTSNYVVLRSYENLLDNLVNSLEVDILSNARQELISTLNGMLLRHDKGKSKSRIRIKSHYIKFDIRHIGDGYMDEKWQKDILQRSQISEKIINIPRDDDYFFSLLYHAKIHKPAVKHEHLQRLKRLWEQIGRDRYQNIDEQNFLDDTSAAQILGGYLAAEGYDIPKPVDKKVQLNRKFIKQVKQVKPYARVFSASYSMRTKIKTYLKKAFKKCLKIIPPLYNFIQKITASIKQANKKNNTKLHG